MKFQTVVEHARNAFWLRACDQVGYEPRLRGRPTVSTFGGHLRIGDRFGLASRPVASHLMTGPDGVIEIGHDVSIAHGAAISAFERVYRSDMAHSSVRLSSSWTPTSTAPPATNGAA